FRNQFIWQFDPVLMQAQQQKAKIIHELVELFAAHQLRALRVNPVVALKLLLSPSVIQCKRQTFAHSKIGLNGADKINSVVEMATPISITYWPIVDGAVTVALPAVAAER